MWTLALRGGARVAVVAAEWCNAFGVVTRGRVQLELRDGEPGPVLGRDAGFWLRGTGIRALRNPGRPTATARIVTPRARTVTCRSTHPRTPSYRMIRNDMNSMKDSGIVAGLASGQTSHTHRLRRLAVTGFIATLAATVATTHPRRCAGPGRWRRLRGPRWRRDDPVVRIRRGDRRHLGRGHRHCRRSSSLERSPRRAIRVDGSVADRDLVGPAPPLRANTATTTALLGLHLVAATVMIPTLARSLRTRTA